MPDGNFSLVPRQGETARVDNETGRVVATSRNDTAAIEADTFIIDDPVEEVVEEPMAEKLDLRALSDDRPPPQSDVELVQDDAPIVQVPEEVSPGGVLKIATPAEEIIYVVVPANARSGDYLIVEGLVEVTVPGEAEDGDLLRVPLPDGTHVAIPLSGADARPGALVAVGFPVEVRAKTPPLG